MAGDLGSSKVLKWLWKAPVDPVLSKLGYTRCLGEYNKWPRVWWIPTGLLSKFPLHAAGLHAPHSTKTTLGRVISSYGSSVKALIHARHHGPQESTTVNLKNIILLGMQSIPRQKDLSYAAEEIKTLRVFFSKGLKSMSQHLLEARFYRLGKHVTFSTLQATAQRTLSILL